MNQRIKELAEQAGSTHKQSLGVYQFYEFELEKFAELIVRECMELVDGYTYPVQTQPYTIYDTASKAIKQHFGVEA